MPRPLQGLADGATYTVATVTGTAFTLAGVSAISVGQATGTHRIGREGLDLTATAGASLNHTLRIDLTGITPGGIHELLCPGGVPLRDVSPPPGAGQSSASARRGSGGFVDVSVPTARATFRPTSRRASTPTASPPGAT